MVLDFGVSLAVVDEPGHGLLRDGTNMNVEATDPEHVSSCVVHHVYNSGGRRHSPNTHNDSTAHADTAHLRGSRRKGGLRGKRVAGKVLKIQIAAQPPQTDTQTQTQTTRPNVSACVEKLETSS